LVIILDKNEKYNMAGLPQIHFRVSFNLESGSDTPDRNGHTVSFYGKQISKAKFIPDPFTEISTLTS